LAALQESDYLVSLLLKHGADVNVCGGGLGSPLCIVSRKGSGSIVRTLLKPDYHTDVNRVGGEYGTPLQAAAAAWQPLEIMLLLLEAGANINANDGDHGTALQIAVRKSATDVVELLLKHTPAPDLNVHSETHGTPLQLAVLQESDYLVSLLLKQGADVNVCGGGLGSPLHLASQKGFESIVCILRGLEPDISLNAPKEIEQDSTIIYGIIIAPIFTAYLLYYAIIGL
jgi:ankyrin repeat protein